MRLFLRLPWADGLVPCAEVALDDRVGAVVAHAADIWRGCCRSSCCSGDQGQGDSDCRDAKDAKDALTAMLRTCRVCDAGGRVLRSEWSVAEAGLQRDSVISLVGTLPGGMMAMQIAYRRAKESKKKAFKSSPFMTTISDVSCSPLAACALWYHMSPSHRSACWAVTAPLRASLRVRARSNSPACLISRRTPTGSLFPLSLKDVCRGEGRGKGVQRRGGGGRHRRTFRADSAAAAAAVRDPRPPAHGLEEGRTCAPKVSSTELLRPLVVAPFGS